MELNNNILKQGFISAVIIIAIGLGIGFLLFRSNIFMPTRPVYQITMASITVGIFYSMLKGSNLRNALAVLLIWYVISLTFSSRHNYSILILNLTYIAGLSLAVYLYMLAIRKSLVGNAVGRIASFVITTAVINTLIILVLALLSLPRAIDSPNLILDAGYFNLKMGTLIGLILGIGIEIAEYVVRKISV